MSLWFSYLPSIVLMNDDSLLNLSEYQNTFSGLTAAKNIFIVNSHSIYSTLNSGHSRLVEFYMTGEEKLFKKLLTIKKSNLK